MKTFTVILTMLVIFPMTAMASANDGSVGVFSLVASIFKWNHSNGLNYLTGICEWFLMVSFVAAKICKWIKTKSGLEDELLLETVGPFMKFMEWLPKVGLNPRTKRLEAKLAKALRELESSQRK